MTEQSPGVAMPAPASKPANDPKKTPKAPPSPDGKRRGGGAAIALALLALLIGGAAAAGIYYLWTEQQRESRAAAATATELQAELGALRSSLETQFQQRIDTLAAGATQADRSLAGRQEALEQAITDLRSRLGQDVRDWTAAEVEHLLRIANQRLQFAGDIGGAMAALRASDQRLAAMGDPGYMPVREAIATELQALENLGPDQRQTAAMRLTGLIRNVDDLPVAGDYRTTDRMPAETEATSTDAAERPPITDFRAFLSALWSDIRGLVTIRRHDRDDTATPLLTPSERFFLHQNLRLKLETARLALLRGDGEVYRASLTEAGQWLGRFFVAEAPATRAAMEALGGLQVVTPQPSLPDISESLRRLRNIEAGRGGTSSTAPERPL